VDLVVGQVGRAHGIRGEVSVALRTDEPDSRFTAGARLRTDRGLQEWLTVASARPHRDRLLVRFTEVPDRTAAERLRGALLLVDAAPVAQADPEEFHDHQLVGLVVRTTSGETVGTVAGVQHLPLQDLLVVAAVDGERLVPFVAALVPEVDLAAGTLTVDAVPGLLDDAAEVALGDGGGDGDGDRDRDADLDGGRIS
jgi:16S rRNA processing protein RimM